MAVSWPSDGSRTERSSTGRLGGCRAPAHSAFASPGRVSPFSTPLRAEGARGRRPLESRSSRQTWRRRRAWFLPPPASWTLASPEKRSQNSLAPAARTPPAPQAETPGIPLGPWLPTVSASAPAAAHGTSDSLEARVSGGIFGPQRRLVCRPRWTYRAKLPRERHETPGIH